MTRLRIVAALFLCLLVTSCAQAPDRPAKADVSAGTTIAVISMAADYARLGSIGTTVFGNEHYYAPLGDWPLDAEMEAEITRSSQAAGPKLVQVSYDRSALFRAYNTRDLDAPMSQRPLAVKGDLQLIRAELAAIAERAGAQRLLLVTKAVCPDPIGGTNQPLNGFGVYFGRIRPESAFALGPGTWRTGTRAYLCADIVLFDPGKGETLASRRVLYDKRTIPTYPLSGFTKSLSDIPDAWRNEILTAFRWFVPVAGSSARDFLKGDGS
jgi:hypothetical protein